MIINLAIEAEPDLCAWLVTKLARQRDHLAAMSSDATEYSFDDCIVGLLWDAYDRATDDTLSEADAVSHVSA